MDDHGVGIEGATVGLDNRMTRTAADGSYEISAEVVMQASVALYARRSGFDPALVQLNGVSPVVQHDLHLQRQTRIPAGRDIVVEVRSDRPSCNDAMVEGRESGPCLTLMVAIDTPGVLTVNARTTSLVVGLSLDSTPCPCLPVGRIHVVPGTEVRIDVMIMNVPYVRPPAEWTASVSLSTRVDPAP